MVQSLARTLHVSPPTLYLIGLFLLLMTAFAVGFLLNRIFHRWALRFKSTWGELVWTILESLSLPLAILGAIYAAFEILTLPSQYEHAGSEVIFALVVIVTFYFLTKVVILFLERWGRKEPALERITEPASFIIKVLFALLAVIVFFENLGIHLTAVWTTLGVGSVAVALALQDTLGNFFAGFYLMVDHPISVGDYIKIDAGQEGFVVHVGWRSTSLRTLGNNMIILPNATLSKAVITNYSRPEERMSLDIRVSVPYGAEARRVEQVLAEVGRQAMNDGLEGLLAAFPPDVKLIPGFGAASLDFTLGVKVRRFVDQYSVQSELRKRILERFEQEGIAQVAPAQVMLINPPQAPARDGNGAGPALAASGSKASGKA